MSIHSDKKILVLDSEEVTTQEKEPKDAGIITHQLIHTTNMYDYM
jgi:hypothetical protein